MASLAYWTATDPSPLWRVTVALPSPSTTVSIDPGADDGRVAALLRGARPSSAHIRGSARPPTTRPGQRRTTERPLANGARPHGHRRRRTVERRDSHFGVLDNPGTDGACAAAAARELEGYVRSSEAWLRALDDEAACGEPARGHERGQAGLSSTTPCRPDRAPAIPAIVAGARAERSETGGAVETTAPLRDGGYGETARAVATRAERGAACAESAGRPLPVAELQEQELRRQKEEQERGDADAGADAGEHGTPGRRRLRQQVGGALCAQPDAVLQTELQAHRNRTDADR
eukprot:COSAG04_NODE_1070_length_8477_cov_17.005729_5_plen_290_part_00